MRFQALEHTARTPSSNTLMNAFLKISPEDCGAKVWYWLCLQVSAHGYFHPDFGCYGAFERFMECCWRSLSKSVYRLKFCGLGKKIWPPMLFDVLLQLRLLKHLTFSTISGRCGPHLGSTKRVGSLFGCVSSPPPKFLFSPQPSNQFLDVFSWMSLYIWATQLLRNGRIFAIQGPGTLMLLREVLCGWVCSLSYTISPPIPHHYGATQASVGACWPL